MADRSTRVTCDKVWLPILDLLLVLLIPVPKERGGAAYPFPPSVEIPVIISAVWTGSSSDPIHCNISRLLASLHFQLLSVLLSILAESNVFMPCPCPFVGALFRTSIYQDLIRSSCITRHPPYISIYWNLSRSGSGDRSPIPLHISVEEPSSPPADSNSPRSI